MKLTEIRSSLWVNGYKITSEQICTSFDQLSNSVHSQYCLKCLEWTRMIKYNGVEFIFTNYIENNGRDFFITIYGTPIFTHFIMNRPAYGKRFWANFHKRLASICDQMIIYQIHNQ